MCTCSLQFSMTESRPAFYSSVFVKCLAWAHVLFLWSVSLSCTNSCAFLLLPVCPNKAIYLSEAVSDLCEAESCSVLLHVKSLGHTSTCELLPLSALSVSTWFISLKLSVISYCFTPQLSVNKFLVCTGTCLFLCPALSLYLRGLPFYFSALSDVAVSESFTPHL